jgi:hypothetical protein
MKRAHLCLFGFLLLTLNCGSAHGQDCQMIPLYSTYESVSATATTIYSYVEVDGYADVMPTNCNVQGVTHHGAAYNEISTTGGWVYGSDTCPSCYIAVENYQSIPGTPTGSYPFNWAGEVICSRIGTLWSTGGSENISFPSISGPNTFWTFNAQSPAGYATSITLTSSGGAGTTWIVQIGANEVHLSTTSGSSTTVSTSGTAFSTMPGDIKIIASINEGAVVASSAPFAVTSRTPYRLIAGIIVPSCDNQWGYLYYLNYAMQDNLLDAFPSTIGVNEAWTTGVTPDYTGTNWTRSGPKGFSSTESAFADEIGGAPPSGSTPTPNCNGPTTPVQHWGQEWYIGSTTPGAGTPVQTDTLQKYINSAAHLIIKSPVTAP